MVQVQSGPTTLEGDLHIPPGARGVVLFAHGSGSGRFSPRNQFVARSLQKAGLGTLLIDLLTSSEESEDQRTLAYRFDIDLLTDRLTGAVDWLREQESTKSVPVGLFGASTGAAAALATASKRTDAIGAVVSRGGRPDLAGPALADARAPTLLIVGGNDPEVIHLNRQAMELLGAEHEMQIVPGATHLFEEPGKLEVVAEMAGEWFLRHLAR